MYELTPALLNLYQDCQRCLWVELHEAVTKPAGHFSSLAGGMYLALQKHADDYRSKGKLPLELARSVDGVFLPDQELMKKWRNIKTALSFEDQNLGLRFFGPLDECIVRKEADGRQIYVPLIFKTRGFDALEQEHDQHSQLQLDCFDLLLQKNGYKTSGTGYIVYYVPEEVRESGIVQFNVQVIQPVTEASRAMNLLTEVVNVLAGKIPEVGESCEYCAWGDLGARMMKT